MTAPRTFLDELDAHDKAKIAAMVGLKPGVAPSAPHPAPTDTLAAYNQLAARREHGGAGGGEFTEPEMAAYNADATGVDSAISNERLAPLIAALKAKMTQRPDATAVRGKP